MSLALDLSQRRLRKGPGWARSTCWFWTLWIYSLHKHIISTYLTTHERTSTKECSRPILSFLHVLFHAGRLRVARHHQLITGALFIAALIVLAIFPSFDRRRARARQGGWMMLKLLVFPLQGLPSFIFFFLCVCVVFVFLLTLVKFAFLLSSSYLCELKFSSYFLVVAAVPAVLLLWLWSHLQERDSGTADEADRCDENQSFGLKSWMKLCHSDRTEIEDGRLTRKREESTVEFFFPLKSHD